jgi:hypothetical protein
MYISLKRIEKDIQSGVQPLFRESFRIIVFGKYQAWQKSLTPILTRFPNWVQMSGSQELANNSRLINGILTGNLLFIRLSSRISKMWKGLPERCNIFRVYPYRRHRTLHDLTTLNDYLCCHLEAVTDEVRFDIDGPASCRCSVGLATRRLPRGNSLRPQNFASICPAPWNSELYELVCHEDVTIALESSLENGEAVLLNGILQVYSDCDRSSADGQQVDILSIRFFKQSQANVW